MSDLYCLCPRCQGSGQVSDARSERVGFLSLPCHDCSLIRVVPLGSLTPSQLALAEHQIAAERLRRDICEHGISTGDWCEPCNREYKRTRAEYGLDHD